MLSAAERQNNMTKSERRLLVYVTAAVSVLLAVVIVFLSILVYNNVQEKNLKGYNEENQRDIFAECAYVAQAHMNCRTGEDDIREIYDFACVSDWYSNYIGFCFFFEPSGYVIVTSYDYVPQRIDLEGTTPFPETPEENADAIGCVYSVYPTAVVLADDGDESTPRQYRTFDAGTCFYVVQEGGTDVYAEDGSVFDAWDRIYPGVISSYLDDPEYFSALVEPNESFRERMLKTADKQMAELEYDTESFAEHVAELREESESKITVIDRFYR